MYFSIGRLLHCKPTPGSRSPKKGVITGADCSHQNSLRKNSGPGNDRQGLKPSSFPIVYGPTKVVQSHDILYTLSLDILYTFGFWRVGGGRCRGGRWRFRISEFDS